MNILMFVSSFLILFALFLATILKESVFFEYESRSAKGSIKTEIALQSKYERYKYREETRPHSKKPAAKSTASFRSHRKEKSPPTLGKFNLSAVFDKDKKNINYESGARLLRFLYGHTPWFAEKDLEYEILDAMLSCEEETVSSLAVLFPKEPRLQEIYYKMLKGTPNYDIKRKKGYPPLEDFLYLGEKEQKAVYFYYASYPVLFAVLGESIAEEILSLERKKWEKDHKLHTVMEEELRSLLAMHTKELKGKAFQDWGELFSFAKKRVYLEKLSYEDPDSHVTAHLPLSP